MTKLEYSDKIYEFLQKMKFDKLQDIDYLPSEIIPSPIAKAFFIDIVKDFIANGNGNHLGFQIEFNNNYERVRKIHFKPLLPDGGTQLPNSGEVPPNRPA
jgi:hypothetical protein